MSDLKKNENNSNLEELERDSQNEVEKKEESGSMEVAGTVEVGEPAEGAGDGGDGSISEGRTESGKEEEKELDNPKESVSDGGTSGSEGDDSPAELSLLEKLDRAAHLISEVGDNRRAREIILEVLKSNPSVEDREYAEKLLRRIEMDIRSLWVGVVAMLTLILIPTVGLSKALWLVPAIFLLLLPIIPGIIASVSFWVVPLFDSFFTASIWKLIIPSAGVLLAFIIILFMQASLESDSEESA